MENLKMDRRRFIRLNTAAMAGAAIAPAAIAETKHSENGARTHERPTGFFRFPLGDFEITVVNDGFFHLSDITPPELSPTESLSMNTSEEIRKEYFQSNLLDCDDPRLIISPVIIETGNQRILVDCGWPVPGSPDSTGRLGSCMDMLGIPRESIDTVVLTHAHPDHAGLADLETGEPVYPNAEVVITDMELGFWTGDSAVPLLEIPLLAWIPDVLDALSDRLRVIRPGDEIASGIRSISTPGHTPGHICVGIEAGGKQLLLTGDAIVNIHTSFERPHWQNFFDIDGEQAALTRRNLLEMAATDDMMILGYHFPFPGLGYALRYDGAYRWHPAGTTLMS